MREHSKGWASIGVGILLSLWLLYSASRPVPTRTFFAFPTSDLAALIPAGAAVSPPITRFNLNGIPLVFVPRGCFLMGTDPAEGVPEDEQPAHEVCLTKSYYIGEFEVTNAQFAAYEASTGVHRLVTAPCRRLSSEADQPAVCVTWEEADAYAAWLGCRLPTEAEWEYAARSPRALVYPWGDAYEIGRANLDETQLGGKARQGIAAVGSYPDGKSWIGAQDMAGNVWEWVADWYAPLYYTKRPKPDYDPKGSINHFRWIVRGGGFLSNLDDARSAFRNEQYGFAVRNPYIGFRVACPVSPAL
jgi:formylglycine-generating enzyme required for sulfatase activity